MQILVFKNGLGPITWRSIGFFGGIVKKGEVDIFLDKSFQIGYCMYVVFNM